MYTLNLVNRIITLPEVSFSELVVVHRRFRSDRDLVDSSLKYILQGLGS